MLFFILACKDQTIPTDTSDPKTVVEGECAIDNDCINGQICEENECVSGDRNNSIEKLLHCYGMIVFQRPLVRRRC